MKERIIDPANDTVPAISRKAKSRDADIPEAVVRRLPRYFRYLRELINSSDVLRVSSADLAKGLDISPSQVRQDLGCIGQTGQQGYGYGVIQLYNKISETLGVRCRFSAVLITARATAGIVSDMAVFEQRGVRLKAAFSLDGEEGTLCGLDITGIEGLDAFIQNEGADIAVVAVDEDRLDTVCGIIRGKGFGGVLNYSQRELHEKDIGCPVQNVCCVDPLMLLTYSMSENLK